MSDVPRTAATTEEAESPQPPVAAPATRRRLGRKPRWLTLLLLPVIAVGAYEGSGGGGGGAAKGHTALGNGSSNGSSLEHGQNGPGASAPNANTKKANDAKARTAAAGIGRYSATVAAANQAAPAATTPSLEVLSARNSTAQSGNAPKGGDSVTKYHWLLNVDNTGNPMYGKDDPRCHPTTAVSFPDGNGNPADTTNAGPCPWPSIHYEQASPVISEGDENNWNKNLALPASDGAGHGLGPGKYLVSVTADGYELGGAHFEICPTPDSQDANCRNATAQTGPGVVTVGLNPFPIPLGNIIARAYADTSPTSGAYQLGDPLLAGFHASLTDFDGQVSVDYYGNPLCTQYVTDPTTKLIQLDVKGNPTPIPGTGGECVTGADGTVTIPNLPPNRYGVSLIPPQSQQGRIDSKFTDAQWVQDTTLEGNHDFDVWLTAGQTGVDTEQVVAGEPVPFVNFGFVPHMNNLKTPAGGEVKGQLMGAANYVPGVNGIPGAGGNSGFSGIKLDRPPKYGWVALSDLNSGTDGATVYAQPTDVNGNFDIKNVPDGDYSLTIWDQPQDYALDQFNVTMAHGQLVDVGVLPMLMWFTRISGNVFVDLNGNGRQDPGEPGVPNFLMQNLNRTNNQYEQGQNTARTNDSGYYEFTEAYPLGQFTILQYFNTRYKTTAVTYQACNDPQEHTVLSPFVDISFLPIIGQCARIDVGVQPYNPSNGLANGQQAFPGGDNGGIVATMLYDSIRVTYPARQEFQFDHMTGIPGFQMDLYDSVPDGKGGYLRNPDGSYQTAENAPVQSYITENAAPPVGCMPLDANGHPVTNAQQDAVGVPTATYQPRCIESSITGVGIGGGTDNNPTFAGGPPHGIQTVDGNYGLDATDTSLCQLDAAGKPIVSYPGTPGCFANHTGDFLVRANIPTDQVFNNGAPLYRMSTEEDVNVAHGEQWIPQNADTSNVTWPPPVDPARQQKVGAYPENPGTSAPGPDPQCAGKTYTVHVTDPEFLAIGGSPFEGQQRNVCDTKLIRVESGQSIAPNFHVHTVVDVPIPGKFSGYIVDDVSASTDRKSTMLGEVSGIAGAPIGVYDWAGTLQYTTTSDYNGTFEVLMPSTQISNCLTPSGVCPNVYRFVGNDPGQWPHPNTNYKPVYRTIAANFQSWPGQFLAADVAPTKAITNLEAPGATFTYPPQCDPAVNAPQIFAVDKPYTTNAGNDSIDIKGMGFGASQGSGAVTLSGYGHSLPVTSWSDIEIKVSVPGDVPPGAHQLDITNGSSLVTAQGLTYHVIGGSYTPTILTVGPDAGPSFNAHVNDVPATHHFVSIQAALEYAAGFDFPALLATFPNTAPDPTYPTLAQGPLAKALVVVYPSNPTPFTPLGTYYENLIIHSPVKVQGVGPGGVRPDGTFEQGTRIDGAYFWSTNSLPEPNVVETPNQEGVVTGPELLGTNEPYAAAWLTLAEAINSVGGEAAGWDGNTNIIEGQVVYVVAKKGQYTSDYKASVDGFSVSGGDQKDFPGNINEAFGMKGGPLQEFGATDEAPGVLQTQGGGFFLNAYADNFQISNNSIKGNSGSYGGAIRIGTPYVNLGAVDDGAGQTNSNVVIGHNQIVGNGGTNLAGAIGLFSGSNGYRITQNVLCGNYALEYGGGISHFGPSGDSKNIGTIDHNKIKLNGSNDEGAGIMIAGELSIPQTVNADGVAVGGGLSPGAGPVNIDSNYIGSNIADDDGGGIRFLMAGTAPMTVSNNFITNNVSSHEGGGIAIDDTTNVFITGDTIARNVTTATATTSNGAPQPTGISTARNSDLLQATLPAGSPVFSNPVIDHTILNDNRAGAWASGGVVGIGLPNDTTAINVWDVGTVDQSGFLSPTHSYIDPATNAVEGYNNDGTNTIGNNPQFMAPFVSVIDLLSIRTYFRFRPSAIVTVNLPANAFGDYRLQPGSPASGKGANIPGGPPQ